MQWKIVRRSDRREERTRRVEVGPRVRRRGRIGVEGREPGRLGRRVKRWEHEDFVVRRVEKPCYGEGCVEGGGEGGG